MQQTADRKVFDFWFEKTYGRSSVLNNTAIVAWDAWQTRGDPDKYEAIINAMNTPVFKDVEYRFHVTYYYLATGMEGRADTQDYGYVMAKNQLEAKEIVAKRECKNPADRAFFKGCLTVRRAM